MPKGYPMTSPVIRSAQTRDSEALAELSGQNWDQNSLSFARALESGITPLMNHEEAFAKAFLPPEKRARFVQLLAQPKRRKEMLAQLSRHLPYQPAFAREVPIEQDFPDELEKLLLAKGAGPTCHVIADGLTADGRELPLREALTQVCMSRLGAILSCLPGRLAYYKPKSPAPGILFERSQP
jgi:hypothetical protein